MGKKIISENQGGGITAETVNIGSQVNQPHPEKKGVPIWLAVTGIVFGIIGALVAVLAYMEQEQMSNDDDNKYHVESHNQQGGITAGVVNVNQNRTIQNTSGILGQLLGAISPYKGKTLKVTALMGDGESAQYAAMVQGFLRQNGYDIEDFIDQVVWEGAMPAISYNDKGGQISVNVGSNI